MNNLSLRIYVLLCTVVMWIRTWAQDDDEDLDDFAETERTIEEVDSLDEMLDFQPVRFDFNDMLLVALLVLACYVFGKIWKGCTYLIIILAAVFYYLSR